MKLIIKYCWMDFTCIQIKLIQKSHILDFAKEPLLMKKKNYEFSL